ncbi:GAF domain-containing protein [Amycolatopsis sp. NPDC059021]|uniref:GAF domain-containing protein n=1 Tax=Amycolatopsis sp. NPDC059021 TaxID=3346704 RepID=UPI00366A869E
MAALHRRTEQRHRTSAEILAFHAGKLRSWLDAPPPAGCRPAFTAALRSALGNAGILLTLLDDQNQVALSTAAGHDALIARDAEFVSGEGPATDAVVSGGTVFAIDDMLSDRWPHYAPTVRRAGVRAVFAVPLQQPISCVGALCVLERKPVITDTLAAATDRVADALARTVLLPSPQTPEVSDPLRLFDETSYQDVVHQAAGMLSVRHACSPDDAVALLRARAFADGTLIEELARREVQDGTGLD